MNRPHRTVVIIVNHNGSEDTARCLKSLNESHTSVQTVVVDNGSNVKGKEAVQEILDCYPRAKLIRSDKNLGFGRGNNLGIRWALHETGCEFVLLLNNDAMVEPDTVDKLEGVLDVRPQAGAAAPRIVLDEDPGVLWYGGGEVDWRKGSARTPGYMGPADAALALEDREVSFASGCAILIRRGVLEEVGGFDPRLFMYEEDVELCVRVRRAGWTIRYVPDALVLHRIQGSQREGGTTLVDMDSMSNPRLPFYAFHRTRNTLMNMASLARGPNALLFAVFFPAVLLRTCLRMARNGRWDGIRAVLDGFRSFARDFRKPRVDELNLGDLGREKATGALAPNVAVVEPVGGHGGMDYYDFGLCEGLARAGAEVTLYTCDETYPERTISYKVRIPYRGIYGGAPAWLRGLRYAWGSTRALWEAKRNRARVAHFHFFHVGPLEFFGVLLARMLGLRVVVTAHDVESFVEHLSFSWMVKAAYRLSARVIAQSGVSERELIKKLHIPKARVVRVPHGNYLRFVGKVPTQVAARDEVGVPREARVLLFFGQIKEVKGLDVLLRAMPRIIQEHPNTVLLVAGKVWKENFQRYHDQIEALRIADHCYLRIRFIPDSEVPNYYAAADVVVLPYRRIYQSGVLLMAMSYGKPVVASDIEGMAEVITDGDNGYLFPADDAAALADRLGATFSNPRELAAVGERGLSYVQENHDWENIGRMTVECYKMALDD